MLFKMGKFYEMFEMDAHVGVEVLGLIYMKVSRTCTMIITMAYSPVQCAETDDLHHVMYPKAPLKPVMSLSCCHAASIVHSIVKAPSSVRPILCNLEVALQGLEHETNYVKSRCHPVGGVWLCLTLLRRSHSLIRMSRSHSSMSSRAVFSLMADQMMHMTLHGKHSTNSQCCHLHAVLLMWKGEQPHCGFPEKNYHQNAERLARAGLKVVVVEQIETPDQLRIRNEEHKANKQNQVGLSHLCHPTPVSAPHV